MNEASPPPAPDDSHRSPRSAREPEPSGLATGAKAKTRSHLRWQWNLATLLLLTACVATWAAWLQTRARNELLRRDISSLRDIAGELVILDPARFAVVQQPQQWHDDHRWRVHLPEGSGYRLALATREVPHGSGPLPSPAEGATVELPAGRHEIELRQPGADEQGRRQFRVLVDGRPAITFTETPDWASVRGMYGMGPDTRTRQQPITEPFILYRQAFVPPSGAYTSPGGSSTGNGVMLWLEAVSD